VSETQRGEDGARPGEDPDAVWRRPVGDPPAAEPLPAAPATAVEYTGPPPTVRPTGPVPYLLVPTEDPPVRLPEQDHDAIDAEEAEGRVVTYGVGAVAGVLMLLLLVALVIEGAS